MTARSVCCHSRIVDICRLSRCAMTGKQCLQIRLTSTRWHKHADYMSIPTKFNPMGADNGSRYLINPIMVSNNNIDTSRKHDYTMRIWSSSNNAYQLFDIYPDRGITIPRGSTLYMELHLDRALYIDALDIRQLVYPNSYNINYFDFVSGYTLQYGDIQMDKNEYRLQTDTGNFYAKTSTLGIEISASGKSDISLIALTPRFLENMP